MKKYSNPYNGKILINLTQDELDSEPHGKGKTFFNTTTNNMTYSDGSAWHVVSSGGGGGETPTKVIIPASESLVTPTPASNPYNMHPHIGYISISNLEYVEDDGEGEVRLTVDTVANCTIGDIVEIEHAEFLPNNGIFVIKTIVDSTHIIIINWTISGSKTKNYDEDWSSTKPKTCKILSKSELSLCEYYYRDGVAKGDNDDFNTSRYFTFTVPGDWTSGSTINIELRLFFENEASITGGIVAFKARGYVISNTYRFKNRSFGSFATSVVSIPNNALSEPNPYYVNLYSIGVTLPSSYAQGDEVFLEIMRAKIDGTDTLSYEIHLSHIIVTPT